MKRASLLVLGTAALALNACIKIEIGGPPKPATPQAAAPQATAPAAPAIAATPATPAAAACNSKYPAGNAAGGQAVIVDLCTVKPGAPQSISFVYYLGQEKIASSADCPGGNWTTYPERKVHYPKSGATQTMLNAVCQQAGHTAAVAAAPAPVPAPAPAPAPAPVSNFTPIANGMTDEVQVFDPPSNVRRSPNGAVICAVRQKQFIKISGYTSTPKGSWYKTNACGEAGWIHVSQVRF